MTTRLIQHRTKSQPSQGSDGVKISRINDFKGQLNVSGEELKQGELGCLGTGREIHLSGDAKSKVLILAGTAHREPIAHYGPFVMNTQKEIEQALRDCRNGTLAL